MTAKHNILDRTLGKLVNRSQAVVVFLLTTTVGYALITSPEFGLASALSLFGLGVLTIFFFLAVHLWRRDETFSEHLKKLE